MQRLGFDYFDPREYAMTYECPLSDDSIADKSFVSSQAHADTSEFSEYEMDIDDDDDDGDE